LYLVDIETEAVLAVFSLDDCDRELAAIAREKEIRARHRVDDPESGLALRDSLTRPLPPGPYPRGKW
jgi:hypothetical protein